MSLFRQTRQLSARTRSLFGRCAVRLRVGEARMPVAPQLVRVVAAKPGGVRLEPVAEATLGCCRLAGQEVACERTKFVAREQPVAKEQTGECRAGRDETAWRGNEARVNA